MAEQIALEFLLPKNGLDRALAAAQSHIHAEFSESKCAKCDE